MRERERRPQRACERDRERKREREGEREREKERERVCIGGRAVNLINETPMADFSRHDELQIRLEGRDSARVLYAALRDIHQPRHELRHSAVPASTDQRGGYKRFGERERERERERVLPTPLRFLSLFFRSYLCNIGPFNYISPGESLRQP